MYPYCLRTFPIPFGPFQKIDENQAFYEAIRPVGHKLTDEESAYLKADCMVLAGVLAEQLERYGKIYRTQASKAFSFFKDVCKDGTGKSNYDLKYKGKQQWGVPDIEGLEDYKGAILRHLPAAVKRKVNDSGKKL